MQNGPIWTHVVAGSVEFEWVQGRLELVRVPIRARAGPGILLLEPIIVARAPGAKGNGKGVIDISDDEMNDVIEHDGVIDISSDDDV